MKAGRLDRLWTIAAAALAAVVGLAVTGCSGGSGAPADAGALKPGCPAREDQISDFAHDNSLTPVDGRQGGWYVYGDNIPTGTFDPPKVGDNPYPTDKLTGNDNCSGPGSFHVKGMHWTDFGAALGTDFKPRSPATGADAGMGVKMTYDASKYKGIAFWAKAAAPTPFVSVKFLDPYTDRDSPLPVDQWCLYTPGSDYNCSPYIVKFGYGSEMDPSVAEDFPGYVSYKIDETWRRFEVLFADTKQDRNNAGQKSPDNKLQVSQLMGMAIQINANYGPPKTANDFEIWIDDVAFIKEPTPAPHD